MAVMYLSPEWVEQINAALAADPGVSAAIGDRNVAVQQVVTGAPRGQVHYWLRTAGGVASVGLGQLDQPEITITQSYDTAVRINRGELDRQRAYLQGRIKLDGRLIKLVALRGLLSHVQQALATVDTEY